MKNSLRRLFLICTEEDEHGSKAPRAPQTRPAPKPAKPAQSVKASADDATTEGLADCKILEVNENSKGDRKYMWVRIVTADGRTLQVIADDPKTFPSLRVGRGEVELRRNPTWKYAHVTARRSRWLGESRKRSENGDEKLEDAVSGHDVVTSADLAELWKVSPRWVMDKARLLKDPLPCYKLDRRTVRFSLAEADQWFHRHRSSGRAESRRAQ